MKKFLNRTTGLLLFCLALTLLVAKLYFRVGFPYTHDGENHLARFANYKVAVKEGQWPPRFAPNLMNHYGYPVFNYNYPLANLLSLPFSAAKVNYQLSFKFLAIGFLAWGLIGTWQWVNRLGVRQWLGQVVAVTAAATTPFVVSLFYHRGNIGEIAAWSLMPWLLFTVSKISVHHESWIKQRPSFIQHLLIRVTQVSPVLLWTAFFLSHNVTVLFGTPLIIGFALSQGHEKPALFTFLKTMVLGMLASLWFWLPAIWEKNQIILDSADLSQGFADHFVSLSQLVWSPLQFGFSVPGRIDTIPLALGLATLIGFVTGVVIIIKTAIRGNLDIGHRRVHRSLLVLIVLTSLTILFQLPVTEGIWKIVPFARFIQFPWRLAMFYAVLSSAVLGLVFVKTQSIVWKSLILGLLGIQVIAVMYHRPVDYFNRTIVDYDFFAQSTTTLNENLPKSFTYESFAAGWQPSPEVAEGNAELSDITWSGSKHSYVVKASTPVLIIEPTMYFLGWQTTAIDQTNTSQRFAYENNNHIGGRIAYRLPAGEYKVTTVFTQFTPARILGNGVSFITLLALVLYTTHGSLMAFNRPVHKKPETPT